ncbi:12235_t:CDS:2, partial [Dentiscutata erythropus]
EFHGKTYTTKETCTAIWKQKKKRTEVVRKQRSPMMEHSQNSFALCYFFREPSILSFNPKLVSGKLNNERKEKPTNTSLLSSSPKLVGRKCSGGENGVRSCNRCRDKGKDCSYVEEIGSLGGHCENHPGFENANDDISYSQNIPNEFCNVLYPQDSFIDSDGSTGYYDLGNLANSPHSTSQINMPQEPLNNAGLVKECLKHGSKIVHHLADLVQLEHRYPQSLTSPTLNEYLKNLLMTLQSESSQMEKISAEQTNNLESYPLDQLYGK